MKKVTKIVLLFIVALLLLSISSIVFLNHLIKNVTAWPELLPDVQLEPSRTILRDEDIEEDNAFYLIRQLSEGMEITSLGDAKDEYDRFVVYGYKGNEYPLIEEWLKRNTKELELCRKAAEMRNCQVTTADASDTKLPYLNAARDKVKALRFKAEREAAEGNWENVLEDYKTMLTLGDHLTRGGCLLNYLVDIALTEITCQSIRKVALQYKVPENVLKSMISVIEQVENNMEPFAETFRYELLAALGMINTVYSEKNVPVEGCEEVIPSFGLKFIGCSPEKTKQSFNAGFSHLIDITSGPYNPERFKKEITQSQYNKKYMYLYIFSGDSIGKILFSMLMPAYGRTIPQYHLGIANLRGTRLFLAVCLYQEKNNGKLPSSLSELSPDYIDKIPEDPFSKENAAFRYVVDGKKWKVYSIGENQVDDGGKYDRRIESHRVDYGDKLDFCFWSDELLIKQEEYKRGK